MATCKFKVGDKIIGNHPTDGMYYVQMDDFCSYGERRTHNERKAD